MLLESIVQSLFKQMDILVYTVNPHANIPLFETTVITNPEISYNFLN